MQEKKRVIARLEHQYLRKYDKKFDISVQSARPNTLWGYGLDLSRCIGCRRCVYGCVKENNHSRHNPATAVDTGDQAEEGQPHQPGERGALLPSRARSRAGVHLHAGPVSALRESPLRQGLSGEGHLEGAGRPGGRRLQLVHRLPVLHRRLSLQGQGVQLGRAELDRRTRSIRRSITWETGRGYRNVVEKCTFCVQRVRAADTPPVWRPARRGHGSSETCSTRTAKCVTSSKTRGCSG